VFVLPSRLESFGFVFIEAWARRKPVIGDSGCPAVASLIEDGVDGYVCSDAAAIADRVTDLLENPALGKSMGEAGYAKVMRKYTWPAVATRVKAIYEQVVAGKPAPGSPRRSSPDSD
jgi:starch synthase